MFPHHGESTQEPVLVTVAEAAEYLRVSERHVRALISEGTLPASKLGPKVIRLKRTDVEALLQPVAASL